MPDHEKYRRAKSQPRGSDTESRILAALDDLLEAGHHIDHISIEHITQASLTSRANFYYHFVSKEAALKALYQQRYDGFIEIVTNAIEPERCQGTSCRQVFGRYFSSLVELYIQHRGLLSSAKAITQREGAPIAVSDHANHLVDKTMDNWDKHIQSRSDWISHPHPQTALAVALHAGTQLLLDEIRTDHPNLSDQYFGGGYNQLVAELADMCVRYLRLDEESEKREFLRGSKVVDLKSED